MHVCDSVSGVPGDQPLFSSEQTFSKEVDDKANSYFQAIYNRGMSVDRLLDELKKFKDSPIKKDRVSSLVYYMKCKYYYSSSSLKSRKFCFLLIVL